MAKIQIVFTQRSPHTRDDHLVCFVVKMHDTFFEMFGGLQGPWAVSTLSWLWECESQQYTLCVCVLRFIPWFTPVDINANLWGPFHASLLAANLCYWRWSLVGLALANTWVCSKNLNPFPLCESDNQIRVPYIYVCVCVCVCVYIYTAPNYTTRITGRYWNKVI